ncbi:Luciferase-like monooxygenase [Thermobaculum terrenum ATCC BAA-798]|uniref:Luciferase-like monooxygenase n=1 Tax=Thermobaculum terrenum (strain ATCC BAA-798 / CCMEE 7001 / YNP1) TaxID=525904 RepID=D1CBS2_THET1|nr:LLM class F420-dependent oxidoreductase [Thermobaculum terrenum]ACZ42237.1 Luciferase-like monooxygenase [Thermobaculum terrenum ATCC BAA-798]
MSEVKFGVFVPQGWTLDLVEIRDPIEQYEAMTNVAKIADSIPGWDSIWVFDHFHTVPVPVPETTFECWTITAALARDTNRVNIGQMVTCNGYRNPALLAKMASTVDVASHGRLYFGLGAGWYEHEWRAYGYGFPETRVRMGMFREACAIIHAMWTQDYPQFEGKYYQIDRPINEPKGVRKPHPSFWIGGGGEKVTLRLVAQYGNACNLASDPELLKHKLEVLRQHCEELGRNYDEIIKSTGVTVHLVRPGQDPREATWRARGRQSFEEYSRNVIVGTPDEVAERLQTIVDAGANYFIVTLPRVAYDTEPLHWFAEEVIPHFQK